MAEMALYKIEATDGISTQTMKFKKPVTLEVAKEKLQQLFEDDYLGLDYYLLDSADNEIMALIQE